MRPLALAAWLTLLLLAAGCTTPPAATQPDPVPIVHEVPAATLHALGHRTVEPSMGVTSAGSLFVVAEEQVLRSRDNGTTWDVVHDYAKARPDGGPPVPPTLDPWLWVDPVTQRIFVDHLTLACTTVSWSDDDGDTWSPELPTACGTPLTDFQKLVTAPPGPVANPLVGRYPSVVHMCYNKPVFDLTGTVPAGRYAFGCTSSYDGGATWPRETTLAQEAEAAGQTVLPGCGGGSWGPAVAPDGTVVARAQPDCLFRTRDSGLSWQAIGTGPGFEGTVMKFDGNGTLYALSADWDPPLRLSVSRDQGEHWEVPIPIQPAAANAPYFVALSAAGKGHLFVTFWATDENITSADEASADARWYPWVLDVTGADTPSPTVAAVQADAHPMYIGVPVRGQSTWFLGDFVTSAIGPDGTGYVVFPDACNAGCKDNANATADDLDLLGTVVAFHASSATAGARSLDASPRND